MMKKSVTILCTASMILSLAGCGGGSPGSGGAAAEKKVILKLSDQNIEGSATNLWEREFADLVAEKTNGTVTIQLYPNNTLTSSDLEAAQAGVVDFVQKPPSTATDLDPRCGAFDAPFIYDNLEHIEATFKMNSQPMQEFNSALRKHNLICIGALHSGNRQLTCNKPIYTSADLSGVKIRVVSSDIYIKLMKALGGTPIPMAWSEVVTSLLTNVIQGQENPISAIVDNNLNEVQDYLMLTNHMPANSALFMNYASWSKLSESQQKAVQEAMEEASKISNAYCAEENEKGLTTLKERGMTIIGEDEGLDVEGFRKAGESIYETFAEDWGNMVDMIKNVEY